MPKKKNFFKPNQFTEPQKFFEYKQRLNNFYRELKYLRFMSDKHEVARQDVLLTPEGPVELYRRDMNGREKFIRKEKLPKIKDRSSRSFIDRISNNQDNYSRHSSIPLYDHSIYDSLENSRSSAILRDNGRYGLAFDWYSPRGRISQVLHEDVKVLETRPTRREKHKYSYSPVSSRAISYYGNDDYYDNYSHYSDDKIFNKENYDIYEYYEYEADGKDGKPTRFFSSRRHTSDRSLTPVPPIPLATKNRKPHKIVSYIDYDTHDDPKIQNVVLRHKKKDRNNKITPLELQTDERPTSSPKGKELWKKVEKYSQNDRLNYSQENLNIPNETPMIKDANISSFDSNFILKENNQQDNWRSDNQSKSNFWGNITLPPKFQQENQTEPNQLIQQNEQENEPVYSFTNVIKETENKNDSMVNFRHNFKKRQPIKSAMKIASEMADHNNNGSKFDDIPGNNAIRLFQNF